MPPRNLPDLVTEKLKSVPKNPGCYLYKGEDGQILYVGKAKILRNRVRSYFRQSANHSDRIERLVRRIKDIEWMVVDSELEALVLECNLIKQHRPPYNVLLRYDKTYPYIFITKETFPRVLFTRQPRRGAGRVFGPFASSYAVRDTLDLLHKNFPLIPCGKSWTGEPVQRPCLYHHLGQCMAPCAGLSDPQAYRQVVDQVEMFLSGREDALLETLREKMEAAAEALDFELAAVIRDRLAALTTVLERQKVLASDGVDRDVIAVVKDDHGSAVQLLFVRNGKLIGQRQFILDGSKEAPPGEAVQEFVKQYYANAPEVPREVLLPVEIAERQIVQQWLRGRRGSAVTLEVPAGGDKLRLMEMAATNAQQALSTFRTELEAKEAHAEQALDELAEAIGLGSPPRRIEGYDISNIQGTAPVGSMVVAIDGQPAKQEYRRFRIRFHPESPNDFAMMHEVITRRLRNFLDGDPKFTPLPDLIMIDGGKGQLSAALQARDELGLSVPMVGLAKKQELIYVPTLAPDAPAIEPYAGKYRFLSVVQRYDSTPVELPLYSPGLLVLRRLRDEAHRFALSFHRKIRDKRMVGSALEEVPGVGPRRKRLLLRTFGSLEAIRRATAEELAAVPTMTAGLANKILDYLNDGVQQP